MNYSEALIKVVEAVKSGRLTMEEIESQLKGDIKVPLDITTKFHMLFCTKHRSGENCRYYHEGNLEKQPTMERWANIAKSYMNEFGLTIDQVRVELDFLVSLLKGSKPDSKRLTIMYFVYYLLDDEQLSKFMERFVQNLNVDINEQTPEQSQLF